MEESLDPIDAALQALASEQRRDVLQGLLDGDEVTVPDDNHQKVVSLAHNHLPHLADRHYIEYHHTEGGLTVKRGANFGKLEPLLEFVLEEFRAE